MKKLTKSKADSKIAGVCSGLGVYFGINATLFRVLFVVFALTGGTSILVYIIMACIMPSETNVFEQ